MTRIYKYFFGKNIKKKLEDVIFINETIKIIKIKH